MKFHKNTFLGAFLLIMSLGLFINQADAKQIVYLSESPNNPESSTILVQDDQRSDSYEIATFSLRNYMESPIELVRGKVLVRIDNDSQSPANYHEVFNSMTLESSDSSAKYKVAKVVEVKGGANYRQFAVIFSVDKGSKRAILKNSSPQDFHVITNFNAFTDDLQGTRVKVSIPKNFAKQFVFMTQSDQLNKLSTGQPTIIKDVVYGSFTGNTHALAVSGMVADLNSTNIYTTEHDFGGTGIDFQYSFDVTAFETDVYIDRTGNGISHQIYKDQVLVDLSSSHYVFSLSSSADTSGNNFVVNEGETETFNYHFSFVANETGMFKGEVSQIEFKEYPTGQSQSYSVVPGWDTDTVFVSN